MDVKELLGLLAAMEQKRTVALGKATQNLLDTLTDGPGCPRGIDLDTGMKPVAPWTRMIDPNG